MALQVASRITSGLSNGNVSLCFILVCCSSLVNATITFGHNGDTNRELNDGWAINDGKTVAKSYQKPTTTCFLPGLGLLGLFRCSKR